MTDTVDEAPSACPSCPNCKSEYSYQVGDLKVCTECAHEWTVETTGAADMLPADGDGAAAGAEAGSIDPAAVIRDLKEKGSSLVGKVKVPTVKKS